MKHAKFILVLSAGLLLASCGGSSSSSASSTAQSTTSVVSSEEASSKQEITSIEESSIPEESSTEETKKYRITFDLNGGYLPTGESRIEDQYVEEGHWAIKPLVSPLKKNCTFLYWAYDGDKFNFTTQIFGDLNLVATYRVNEEDKVTLTFDPNNGEPTFTIDTFLGDTVNPPIPSKSGMAFKGWFLDGNENNPFTGYVSTDAKNATKIVALYGVEEFNFRFEIQEDQSICITGVNDRATVIITVPESIDGRAVTTIKDGAFGSLTKLKQVYLSSSITSVTAKAFLGSYGLTTITVDGGNNNYKSINGVLFNRNGSELVCFPFENATSYTVPAGVRKIGDYAFYASNSYSNLTSINFNEGLEEIGERAFYQQKYLSNITFPSTLRKIGDGAFMMFDSATQVTLGWNEGLEEIGDSAFFGIYLKGILALPDTVKKIGEYAFAGLNGVEAIVLPASLEEFGQAAFFQDYGVKQITLPSGNPYFIVSNNILYTADNKTVLYVPAEWSIQTSSTDLNIPEGVTSLAPHSFSDVRYISGKINLPSTLEVIGEYAFHYNQGISTLEIPASVKRIEHDAFDQCGPLRSLTLNEGLEFIGEYAFSSCTALKSIEIPGSVKIIDKNAFFGTPLSSVKFNEGLEEIGNYAFYYYPEADDDGYTYGSSSLESVTFPNSLKSIGEGAFGASTQRALKTVTFGSGIETIGEQAFYNCPITTINIANGAPLIAENLVLYTAGYEKLLFASSAKDGSLEVHSGCKEVAPYACYGIKATNIILPEGLVTIGEGAFASTLTYSDSHTLSMPSTLKTIGDSAFRFANNIVTLTLNEGLEYIGDSAFSMCDFTALSIPDSVTHIGESAFSNCAKIAALSIGNSLAYLGEEAFFGCYGISGELALPKTLEYIGEGAFAGYDSYAYGNGNKLTNFAIDAANPAYVCENGVIYDINKTVVVASASNLSASSLVIPDTVTRIASYGLANLDNVTSLTLPEGLESIGDYGLAYSDSIISLTLPKKTINLGERVFYGWQSSQTIVLSYTKECVLKYFPQYWDSSCQANIIYGLEEIL